MSALWAPLQAPVEERTRREGESRRLRAVPALPARMARIPFITVLIAIFGVGMVGLLVVNTSLQNQAFESRALNRQAAQLVYAEAELQSQLNQVRTPEQIATKASALGMRANPYPAFLVVPSGKVIGEQHRIKGDRDEGSDRQDPRRSWPRRRRRERPRPGRRPSPRRRPKAKAEAAQKKAAEKAAARAGEQRAAADAAARKAVADAAAKQKAAEAAKKKAQQGGGN